ncbi:3-oxoacyl-ACP synthase III family protein [Streptomyces sp. NBC_01571]|uniref:3-oxoacyl-ACP synthase III family protein n=1 Tax=Streptomyces sp. NBC_01571 TaxID=2975883 RepID=UPI00225262F1|nr:3-oxoacyl-ACP synthase III family protein [Streptomyces sp. NBC_01571]MCX4572152.1 3-oxoacyl-ACP synthase III family protein [Streptomyces sp. NBC_01571]
MTVHSSIVHATVHIPEGRQSVAAVEDRFRAGSPAAPLSRGVLQRMYGLAERIVAADHDQPSDLAVHAARRLLADTDTDPAGVDLLLYAGILADMEEPATAHVVADKLGLGCPVLDLKNACNGVLNALEVADAFIRGGRYRRVLVTTAEVSTRESRWEVDDPADILTALPSLSTGDMGSALLVEASGLPGIVGSRFFANSWGWRAATLPNPYAQHRRLGHLRIDSAQLVDSFEGLPGKVRGALKDFGVESDDLDLVCVHQPSVPFTRVVCDWVGVDPGRILATFPAHGNVATNTIPLQLATALECGRLRRGDLVGMFGFASGASAGVVLCRW